MSQIFKDTFNHSSLEHRVCVGWNCGVSLKSAVARFEGRLNKLLIISLYRSLYRKGWHKSPKQKHIEALEHEVFKAKEIAEGTDYARWKGWTGAGHQVKQTLSKQG